MGNLRLVAWSGGCDSTLVLWQELQRQKVWIVNGEPAYEVRTLSVTFQQITQSTEQRRARDEIEAELKRRGYAFQRHEAELIAPSSDQTSQAFMWVALAQVSLHKAEDFVVGWVRGDDCWHHAHELRAAFDAAKSATYREGRLETPLEWWSKPRVIAELDSVGLLGLAWWCEDPVRRKGRRSKACGACRPCEEHAAAKWRIARNHRLLEPGRDPRPIDLRSGR